MAAYQRFLFRSDWPSYLRCWQGSGLLPATVEDLKARFREAGGFGGSIGTEEDALRRIYGKRYDLLVLGVPLDMVLPGFSWQGVRTTEPDARKLDRKRYRALVRKAVSAADRLIVALQDLAREESIYHTVESAAVEAATVEVIGGPGGEMHLPAFGGIEDWETYARSSQQQLRAALGHVRERNDQQHSYAQHLATMKDEALRWRDELAKGLPGRPADHQSNELVRRLRGLGLSDGVTAKILTTLGIEEAGDSRSRVRQRRRRLKK